MDLGIDGKNAIVCASSKGLGKACALSLAAEGVNIVINGRNAETLSAAEAEIKNTARGSVVALAADVTTESGRGALLDACPDPDILINNAGGPPPGDFREWGLDEWNAALNANMLTPIMLTKAVVDGMMERGFGRIVNITSVSVKSPIAVLGLSNGARAGLTGFIAGLARQVACRGVTINGVLPGPFETDRLAGTMQARAKQTGKSFQQVWDEGKSANPTGRYGDPYEFGQLCAYLCSCQGGYVNAQNIVIDGGGFTGTL